MEDKSFDLLTKMYGEFSEFRNDITQKVGDLTQKVEDLTQKVDKNSNHILRLENDLKNNIKALYDGYEQTYEKLIVVEKKVDALSDKVENQEVEIKVIKGGKA